MRIAGVVALAGIAASAGPLTAQRGETPGARRWAATAPQPFAAPQLLNQGVVPRLMRWYYPDPLRRTHTGGEVVVTFVVDTLGRADAASMDVVRTDDLALVEATRSVVARLRFAPGRLNVPTSRAIPVQVTIPFVWDAGAE